MLNIQFQSPTSFPNVSYSVKEMVKLFDIKSNDFNHTISTVYSDSSIHFEQNYQKLEKQKSNFEHFINQEKKVIGQFQNTSFSIDQDCHEVFNPVYPSMTDIFKQNIKKCNKTNQSLETKNKKKTRSNFSQNKYNNYHIDKNYFDYIWQVGDEFSEIHCFPLF